MRYGKVAGVVIMVAMVAGLGANAWGEGQPSGLDLERTVTLITGDRVAVDQDSRSVRTWPGKGRDRIRFSTHRRHGQTYVIPNDAIDCWQPVCWTAACSTWTHYWSSGTATHAGPTCR